MSNSINPNFDFSSQTAGPGTGANHQNDIFVLNNALRSEIFNEYETLFNSIAGYIGDMDTINTLGDSIPAAIIALQESVQGLDSGELTYYRFAQYTGSSILADPNHQTRPGDAESHSFDYNNASDSSYNRLEISGGTSIVGSDKANSTIVEIDDADVTGWPIVRDFSAVDEETIGTITGHPSTWSGGELHTVSVGGTVTLNTTHLKTNGITGDGDIRTVIAVPEPPNPPAGTFYHDETDFTLNMETGEITGWGGQAGNPFKFYYVHHQYRRDLLVLKNGTGDVGKLIIIEGVAANSLTDTTIGAAHNPLTEMPIYEVIIRPENTFNGETYRQDLPDEQIIDLRIGRRPEEARKRLLNGPVDITQDQLLFDYRSSLNVYVKSMKVIVDGTLVNTSPTVLSVPAGGSDVRLDAIRVAKDGTVDLVSGDTGSLVLPSIDDETHALAGAIEMPAGQTVLSGELFTHLERVPTNKHLPIEYAKDRVIKGFDISSQSFTISGSWEEGESKLGVTPDGGNVVSFELDAGIVLVNGTNVNIPVMASAYSLDLDDIASNESQIVWVGVNKRTLKIDYRTQDYAAGDLHEILLNAGGETYFTQPGNERWKNFIPLYVFMAHKDTVNPGLFLLSDSRDFSFTRRARIKTGTAWRAVTGDTWTDERIIIRHDLGVSDCAVFVQPHGRIEDAAEPFAPAIEYINNNEVIVHMPAPTAGTIHGVTWIAISDTDMIDWGIIKAGYDDDTSDALPINYEEKMYSGNEPHPALMLSNIYHDDYQKDEALIASPQTYGLNGELTGLRAHIYNGTSDEVPTPHYVNYAIFPDSMIFARGNVTIDGESGTALMSGTAGLDISRITLAQEYQAITDYTIGSLGSIDKNYDAGRDQVHISGSAGEHSINWFTLREPIAPGYPYGQQDL